MGNPYPVDLANNGGEVLFGGKVTFTDPANQPGGGSQTVQVATASFTAAQIKNVAAVPLVLVAAPGALKLLNPSTIIARYTFVTTAYTVPAGWRVALGANPVTGVVGSSWSTMANNLLPAGANTIAGIDWAFEVIDSGGQFADADGLNLPLTLGASASPTLGDGTLKIIVFYTVADFS